MDSCITSVLIALNPTTRRSFKNYIHRKSTIQGNLIMVFCRVKVIHLSGCKYKEIAKDIFFSVPYYSPHKKVYLYILQSETKFVLTLLKNLPNYYWKPNNYVYPIFGTLLISCRYYKQYVYSYSPKSKHLITNRTYLTFHPSTN